MPSSGGKTLAVLESIAQGFVFFVLLVLGVGKIVEYGLIPHIEHFTNWSWTLQTVFYIVTIAAPFALHGYYKPDSRVSRFTQVMLVIFFFPLHGTIWTVLIVVSVLLGSNSTFLTDIFETIPPNVVMLGNDIYHFWPLIVILVYYIFYRRLIFFSINWVLNEFGAVHDTKRMVVFILYSAYAPAVYLAIYGMVFDPHVIYKTTIWTVDGAVVALGTLTIFNLVPLLAILGPAGVGWPVRYPDEFLGWNDSDAEKFREMYRSYFTDLKRQA